MKKGIIIFWGVFLAAAIFRVSQSYLKTTPNIGDCLSQTVSGIGTIDDEPTRTESGQMLVVRTEKLTVTHLVSGGSMATECPAGSLIRMKTKLQPRFSFGDRVSFAGKLLSPMNFDSQDGRTFDYRGYLAKSDIYFEIISAIVRSIADEAEDNRANLTSRLYSLKNNFVANIEQSLGEPHAALAAGLVVGEKAALGKELLESFRAVGLIHIVVLSGYNITIVADALRRLLRFLPRVWGICVGGLGIVMFGILVGGGATVVRSCLMASVALSADLIRRDYNVVRALILAGLVMIIQNPLILLHDLSFQLSFLATLGLILLAAPIESFLKVIPEKFGLRRLVASTVATQIFVSPYILYIMGQISVIGVVVNILVLPLIPITMLLVFMTGAIGFISLVASRIVGWGTHILLSYELLIVQKFAQFSFSSVHVPVFSIWYVAGFYMLFTVSYLTWKNYLRSRSSSDC